jgi:hypothetical protein
MNYWQHHNHKELLNLLYYNYNQEHLHLFNQNNPPFYPPAMQEAYENALAYVLKRDASLVYKAGKGMGTHDNLLIHVMTQRTKSQIQRIDINYRELKENSSKRSINEFLKSECGGDYGRFLKYVAKTRPKFLADQLSKAMDGKKIM